MSMSVGASSSSARSYLQQLLQQGKAGATDATAASDPLSQLLQAISGGGVASGQPGSTLASSNGAAGSKGSPFGADTMSALLSAQGQQSAEGPSEKLFAKLDADGDGKISKSEFVDAAGKAGADSSVADAVFDKIDGDGDSDGSISQSELAKADHGGRRRRHRIGGAGGGQGSLDALMAGADASSGGINKSNANLIEQLIKLQSQVLSAAKTTLSAIA